MHIDFNFYDASFQVTRILPCMLMFLVADTQLYKRLCLSVGRSVRPLVRLLVRGHKLKSEEISILDAICACEWGTCGVDWGWMPLPTRPQRHCDPASLVTI